MADRRTQPSGEITRSITRSITRAFALALTAAPLVLTACDPTLKHVPTETSSGAQPPAPPSSAHPQAPASSASSNASSSATTAPATSSGAPAASPAPRALSPLTAAGALVELPVEGYPPAVISVPLGATARRPVVLATHGNFDRPEWQCQIWRDIVGPSVFVLCPRGDARRDSPAPDDIRFTYANNQALEREIRAGLAALRALYPDHVDPGPVVYTGFSLGAITGVAILGRDPALFPRAILVEGGNEKWTPAAIAAYAKAGGQRLLIACGQPSCVATAKHPASRLDKAGIPTRIVHGKGVGHGYTGAVADEIKTAFSWLVEGDPRFAP